MEITVVNLRGEVDQLTIERTGDQVRVLHQEQTVAEILVDDLSAHLALRTRRRWTYVWRSDRTRAWGDLTVTLARRRKVRLAIRGRIGVNTLTTEELQAVETLLPADAPSSAPPASLLPAARRAEAPSMSGTIIHVGAHPASDGGTASD
jgi:hypothetical protein